MVEYVYCLRKFDFWLTLSIIIERGLLPKEMFWKLRASVFTKKGSHAPLQLKGLI